MLNLYFATGGTEVTLNGDMLRDRREILGKTQQEVAMALRMSTVTVNRAENYGTIHPSTGRRICRFYKLDMEKLIIKRVAKIVASDNAAEKIDRFSAKRAARMNAKTQARRERN